MNLTQLKNNLIKFKHLLQIIQIKISYNMRTEPADGDACPVPYQWWANIEARPPAPGVYLIKN